MLFNDIDRFGASDDTTPAASSIFFDRPMILASQSFGYFGGVKLTNRLSGVFESGVVLVDDNLGNNSGYLGFLVVFGESIVNSLGEPITDLTLTHGDGGFERHGWSFFGSGGFFVDEDVADLRTVTMGNDDFVLIC